MAAESRRRRVIFRVVLVLAGSLTALAIGEGMVRVFLPQYQSIQTDRAIWEHDQELGWIGRRGAEVLQGFDGASTVPVQINSRGFRDDETAFERQPGTTRIVVLGDSVAFGFGVAVEARLTEVLERRLACHDAEFVNLGVSGYSTDQELLVYRREGSRYQPDAVVLVYTANDRRHNGRASAYGHPKPTLRLQGATLVMGNVPVPEPGIGVRVKYALQRHSALYNLVRESSRTIARSTGINQLAHSEAVAAGQSGAANWNAFELTGQLILQLRDEVEASGASFLVVVATTNADLSRNSERNVELLNWCRQVGLECLDTFPSIESYGAADPEKELFLQDRLHWTALGHQVAAEPLLERMLELGWIPDAC